MSVSNIINNIAPPAVNEQPAHQAPFAENEQPAHQAPFAENEQPALQAPRAENERLVGQLSNRDTLIVERLLRTNH